MNFAIKVDPHVICTTPGYLQLSASGRAAVDAALLALCADWLKAHDASTLIVRTGMDDQEEAANEAHAQLVNDFVAGIEPNTQIFLRDADPDPESGDWVTVGNAHVETPVIYLNGGLTNPKEFTTIYPSGGGGNQYVGSACFRLEFSEAS